MFCFMFLFFVGCTDGGSSGFFGEDVDLNQISMQGVKVLSKPSDYDFADAVGDYSENYYNLFAREILDLLYSVYEDDSVTNEEDENKREIIYSDLDTGSGYTYSKEGSSDEQIYYLYDSLRYTISSVEEVYDELGDLEEIVVTLDTSSAWNWTIFNDAVDKSIIFLNADFVTDNTDNKDGSFIMDGYYYSDWTEIYDNPLYLPSFSEFYTYGESGSVSISNDNVNVNYWISPYYNTGSNGDAVNYFQDALEYAVYLFVLEYDLTEDAEYFNFMIEYDEVTTSSTYGQVTGISVGGWGNSYVSISEALDNAKELYDALGGYVGLTDENKEQVEEFIKTVIIGEKAYKKNTFTVQFLENSAVTETLTFNRNYDQIIANIIEYACDKAPIGTSSEGTVLTLDEPFLASQITDYAGNYFGTSYTDNSDENMFEFIPAAEYQSIVIYPNEEDYGKVLGDLWLAFEYYDEDNPTGEGYGSSITINVGLRYYDASEDETYDYVVLGKEIAYEKLPTDNSASDFEERYESHFVTFSDTGTGTDYAIGNNFVLSEFNNDIGNGAINPYANGTSIDSENEYRSLLITASSSAREYYMINKSSSGYGFYGTLNSSMFSVENENVGEDDACDYIEIYFDIVKTKGVIQNYNFKVAIALIAAQESA